MISQPSPNDYQTTTVCCFALCSMFCLFNGFNGRAEGSLWKDLFILFTVELLHEDARFMYSGLLTVNRSANAAVDQPAETEKTRNFNCKCKKD